MPSGAISIDLGLQHVFDRALTEALVEDRDHRSRPGSDLLFELAGEEAILFLGADCRPGDDDLLDVAAARASAARAVAT
jgi:hypothetical protein